MNSRFPINLKLIDPHIYDENILEIYDKYVAVTELSLQDCMFLAGLIKRFKPRKLLEVGVSAGGSSAVILALLDNVGLDSELISVDLNAKWYKDESLPTGWAVEKFRPGHENWRC